MIQDFVINIDAPICPCEQPNLGWGLISSMDEFYVQCSLCERKATIPWSKVKASFNFHRPPKKGYRVGKKDNVFHLIDSKKNTEK